MALMTRAFNAEVFWSIIPGALPQADLGGAVSAKHVGASKSNVRRRSASGPGSTAH